MNIETAFLKMLKNTNEQEVYPMKLGFIDTLDIAEDVGFKTDMLMTRINLVVSLLIEPVISREEAIAKYEHVFTKTVAVE